MKEGGRRGGEIMGMTIISLGSKKADDGEEENEGRKERRIREKKRR